MKRSASVALVLALSAVLALTGAVAAKDHPTPNVGGAGPVPANMTVKGNASHPGGVFRVLAVVHAMKDVRPATVNAIVHFATGDVAVVLTESGHGAAYHGNVPVPGNEPAGTVKIDATAVVDGATLTATGSGKIVIETTDTTETTETTTCTSTATETVTTTETVTVTETSTATETTESEESSETSESAETSDASETDQAEAGDSGSCGDGNSHGPWLTLTPQSIEKLIAFLESLLD